MTDLIVEDQYPFECEDCAHRFATKKERDEHNEKEHNRDIHNAFKTHIDKRMEVLVDQIYHNMIGRGIISGEPEDEGIEKSELYLLAIKIKKITLEELSDELFQKVLML